MAKKPASSFSKTKVVILAGGYGTRLSEETELRPKPMIEIGGMPILWHIMKIYSHYGLDDFIICLGYRGYVIKEYFKNYFLHTSDVTFDLKAGSMIVHAQRTEPWRVTLVDTGMHTMTGGRLKRVRPYLDPRAPFMMTYGDGVSDVDLEALYRFHVGRKRLATVTAIQPPGRFGNLQIARDKSVSAFSEKPRGDGTFINGGFFVFEPGVFDYLKSDETILEKGPLGALARDGELAAFEHRGFWYAMDTRRDMKHLEELWSSRKAPWKMW